MNSLLKRTVACVMVLALAFSVSYTSAESDVEAAGTVPGSLTYTLNDDDSAVITWSTVSGASSYNIYEAESRFAEYDLIDSVSGTSYDGCVKDKYYKVSAVVSGTESSLSDPISYEIELFGYNTYIFEDTDDMDTIQSTTDEIFEITESNQFGSERYALLFAPGTYSDDLNVKIGFYTQVAGMGISPEDTVLGNIQVPAEWMMGIRYDGALNYSALCNFWRTCENLTTTSSTTMWAVSQATSFRRMNVSGTLLLHENGGYASGGYIADSKIGGSVDGGSQQQFFTRNTTVIGNSNYDVDWSGVVWNNVLVGCNTETEGTDITGVSDWPDGCTTTVETTPEVAEKPFLTVDSDTGEYGVFVPSVTEDTVGVSWDGDTIEGETISIDEFYVADPDTDTAATINAALASGKNLILTPGIYEVTEPIQVVNEDTIVLGLGIATIKPVSGTEAMTVADVGGVRISGILFDAGTESSSSLLTVGTESSSEDHSDNPTVLSDTFYRVGGATETPGTCEVCLIINSDDVIGDNFWIWRADHGSGVGWYENMADTGIIVNGDDVTAYALMVEHFQKNQTIWNGNGGKVYMYQSELPYDIPSQDVWNQSGSYGYTDYLVSDSVTSHEGYGIGIYSCYQAGTCFLKSAVECPDTANVKFTNVLTYSLSGNGGIDYVINTAGYGVYSSGSMSKVMSYCNGVYTQDATYESKRISASGFTITYNSSKKAYTGKKIKPSVTVTYSGIELREGTDYKVTYSNNKKIGTAKIKVSGIGAFKSYKTVTFNIVPAKVKIKKVKVKKKKITVKFSHVAKTKKYQVVVSTSKSFKKKKTTKITTTKKVVSFKRNNKKTYYIKVRGYKKVKNKVYYGKYSKVKKVKKAK